jgi:hypothetical protein
MQTEPRCRGGTKRKRGKKVLASSINEKKEMLVAVPATVTTAVPATTTTILISLFMSLAVDKQY